MVHTKKHTCKVEFLKTIAGVGKAGEIKEVSIAQANNQLLPKKIAKIVTDASPSSDDVRKKIVEKSADIQKLLHGKHLVHKLETNGANIASHFDGVDVCTIIKKQFRLKLLPDMIRFDEVKHPKKIGKYTIHIDIIGSVYIKMYLDIQPKHGK